MILLRHLIEDDWGRRQFDYANTPLGWAFTVLRTLLADDHAGLAEDLATEFFRAEQQWDRWPQLNETVRWLKSLPESRGAVMARAIRRAGAPTITTGRSEPTELSVAPSLLSSGCRDRMRGA